LSSAQINIKMNADEARAWEAFNKLRRGAKGLEDGLEKISAKSRKLAGENARLARESKKVYDDTRTPQERYYQKLQQLNLMVGKCRISTTTYGRAIKQLNDEYRTTGETQKSLFGQAAQTMIGTFTGNAGLRLVTKAISEINAEFENTKQYLTEISREAQKAQNEIIAMAALQEGGKKAERVEAASSLGKQYGVTDRGQAFETVQAMQSIHGDFKKGMEAAKTVFAASQVGVPVEFGRELEILGRSQGQGVGDSLRRAYVAGQESGRDPKALAQAAAGLSFWTKDVSMGFAAAGVLSGTVPEAQLSTYLKRGGMGLSTEGAAGAQEWFNARGLKDAGQYERLKGLHAAGMDSTEKLNAIGFTEIRERQAVAALVKNFSDIGRVYEAVNRRAVPGLFESERGKIEKEIPQARTTREIAQLKAAYADQLAFGEQSERALVDDRERRIKGLVMKKAGLDRGLFGTSFLDEEGKPKNQMFFDLTHAPWAMDDAMLRHEDTVRREFGIAGPAGRVPPPAAPPRAAIEAAAALQKAAEKLDRAADKLGGPKRNVGLGKPDQDR